VRRQLTPEFLEHIASVCHESPTYLDRYYALQPGRANGAKRLIALLPLELRGQLAQEWIDDVGQCATLVWRGAATESEETWAPWEFQVGELAQRETMSR
jgi:hypothetical protein